MDIISWIIIILVVLFAIIGYFKGFFNIVLGVLKSISSFIISFFLAKPFGNLLYKIGIGKLITNKLEYKLFNDKELFNIIINSENKEMVIKSGLENLKIPDFLHNIICQLGDRLIGNIEGQTVGHFLSSAISNLCCIIIAFMLLMLFSGVIFLMLRKVFNKISKVKIVKRINKILGVVINVGFVLLLISLVFFGIATITTFIPSFNEKIIELFNLNNDKFTIAKWMYENNFIVKLFEKFVK